MRTSDRYPGAAVIRPRGEGSIPAAVFSLLFLCSLTVVMAGPCLVWAELIAAAR